MFCPHCGSRMPDGAAFCPACGEKAIELATPSSIFESAAPPAATQEPPSAPDVNAPPAPAPSATPAYPPPSPIPAVRPSSPAPEPAAPPVAPPAVAPPAIAPPAVAPASANAPAPIDGGYAKSSFGARLLALMIDSIIGAALLPVGIMLVVASATRGEQSVPGLALIVLGSLWQITYTLGRDAFGGAGIGKRLTGLVVVSSKDGRIASAGPNILRQLVLYAVQLVPVLGSLIEPALVLIDKDGKRLGDKAAKTQVVARAAAQAMGVAAPASKGAAIGVLAAALVVNIIGGVIGGVVIARSASGLQPTLPVTSPTLETPAQATPAEEPVSDAPVDSEESVDAANPLNKETAVDAVGNLLNYLKENDVESAREHATRNFQEEKDWFFAPAGGALASFEVTDVYQDQALWVVEVTEDWISGPQKSRYFVIVEDQTPRVDDVDQLEQ